MEGVLLRVVNNLVLVLCLSGVSFRACVMPERYFVFTCCSVNASKCASTRKRKNFDSCARACACAYALCQAVSHEKKTKFAQSRVLLHISCENKHSVDLIIAKAPHVNPSTAHKPLELFYLLLRYTRCFPICIGISILL